MSWLFIFVEVSMEARNESLECVNITQTGTCQGRNKV